MLSTKRFPSIYVSTAGMVGTPCKNLTYATSSAMVFCTGIACLRDLFATISPAFDDLVYTIIMSEAGEYEKYTPLGEFFCGFFKTRHSCPSARALSCSLWLCLVTRKRKKKFNLQCRGRPRLIYCLNSRREPLICDPRRFRCGCSVNRAGKAFVCRRKPGCKTHSALVSISSRSLERSSERDMTTV